MSHTLLLLVGFFCFCTLALVCVFAARRRS
jgi:hypothetical protein